MYENNQTDPHEKMTKAKAQLLISKPFYASILYKLNFSSAEDVPTMATDGKSIYWNPSYASTKTLNEIKFIICHEVMHVIFMHMLRLKEKNKIKWNQATDYAINSILKEEKDLEFPNDGLYDPKYKDMSAEEIYQILPDPDECECDGEGSPDHLIEPKDGEGNPLSKDEVEKLKQKITSMVAQATVVAKQRGEIPAGLKRYIDELLYPKINWVEKLRQFVEVKSKNDYSWSMPNRKHIQRGFYLPSMYNEEIGEAVLVFDTSGSVSNKEMTVGASEFSAIADSCQINKIWVLSCDCDIQNVQEFDKYDLPVTLEPKGGGGTDLRKPFEWLIENDVHPSFIVYMTDLYGPSPEIDPGIPTIWLCTSKEVPESYIPNFGEVLYVDIE